MRYADVMSRRPMYRWKSFWLGVVVLCFLGWAWVRSMTWVDCFTWAYEDAARKMGVACDHEGISMIQSTGQIHFQLESMDPFGADHVSHWSALVESGGPALLPMPDASDPIWESYPGGAPHRYTGGPPDPFAADGPFAADDPFAPDPAMKKATPGPFPEVLEVYDRGIMVTHWLVCAVFLLVWGGWLVWRWWRGRVC